MPVPRCQLGRRSVEIHRLLRRVPVAGIGLGWIDAPVRIGRRDPLPWPDPRTHYPVVLEDARQIIVELDLLTDNLLAERAVARKQSARRFESVDSVAQILVDENSVLGLLGESPLWYVASAEEL